MASTEDEKEKHVAEFLDKEFGGSIEAMSNISKILEEQEKLGAELERKIKLCKESTTTTIEETKQDGHEILTRIDSLNDEKASLQAKEESCSTEEKDLFLKLENLHEQIEEINCLQVYLSWIFQICHLSKELSSEIEKGNLAIAVEFCVSLTDIAQRLSKSSCQNLVDYAVFTNSHWLKIMSDILSSNMEVLLNEMKWPFPSGILSPALDDSKDDVLTQFQSSAALFLKLHQNNCEKSVKTADNITKLMSILVKPLQKRFMYHFYGPRKTNNIEKPEWYFTQVLNWIRDHSLFLENFVQPLVDKAGFSHCSVQHDFMRSLMETCIEKIKSSLPQISANEALFTHLIDEVLLFDNEMKSLYNYPSNLPGCVSTLVVKPYLDQWLQLEIKSAIKTIDDLLAKEEALKSKYADVENIDDVKPPECIDNFMIHISLITERYKILDDPEIQLQFVEMQIFIFEIFINRLKELAKEANVSPNYDIYFALMNGCHYMIEILSEWTEQIFYIQLHCAKFQLSSKPQLMSARLEDSITEESIDTSVESSTERSNLLVEKTLFEDILSTLENVSAMLMESLLKRIESKIRPMILHYKAISWHSFPSSKDIVTPILSNGACQMLMFVKETLQSTKHELYDSIFTKFWQNLARSMDSMIFNQVVLECHFNEGGAMQLNFDLMKSLLLLFQSCTQKPESYFKLIKESCSLLTLLPGSAVLLKEVLNSAIKSDGNKKKQKNLEATNSLLDIGIKNISTSLSFRIISSRIDLPKI